MSGLKSSGDAGRSGATALSQRIRGLAVILCAFAAGAGSIRGQETNSPQPIDLATALRLAGAQNLDVQIARAKLAEAKAAHQSALSQFLPWISPGITYRQHDDRIQDVAGNVIVAHKYSYAPGATVGVQLDLGDAIYASLTAKQLVQAAGHALEAQRQQSVLAATQLYFDLALAQGAVNVALETVAISRDYESQLNDAVQTGIAFKGDLLRVRVQADRDLLALRQAREQRRVAAARLARSLRLDSTIELVAQDAELAPLALIDTNAALDSLVQQSLASRPELKQNQSAVSAARDSKNGAAYGPLIPSLGAQAFWGGLGGGRRGVPDTFGPQEDYLVGATWRIGPGGLLDFGRVHSAKARLETAELTSKNLRDEATRQVVESFARWQSLGDQLQWTADALAAAEEGLRLARERKEFAVGVVLETIQAQQDLTRARLEYLKTIAEFDKAQYALLRLTGKL
jgi:outer membrane protein TolC